MKNLVKNFNQFINESWDPRDDYEQGVFSNCCGAPVIHGDVCSECGEHCDPETDEYPEDQDHELEPRNFEDDEAYLYEKKSKKDAQEKYQNLKLGAMKNGPKKMKDDDFEEKPKKNFKYTKG